MRRRKTALVSPSLFALRIHPPTTVPVAFESGGGGIGFYPEPRAYLRYGMMELCRRLIMVRVDGGIWTCGAFCLGSYYPGGLKFFSLFSFLNNGWVMGERAEAAQRAGMPAVQLDWVVDNE